MGVNNSTHRVSFESDEHENIMVVKGVWLSNNVINRMKEPTAPSKPNPDSPSPPPTVPTPPPPPPVSRPVPPLFDPITSLPPLSQLKEPVAPPAPPPSSQPAPPTSKTVSPPTPPPKPQTEKPSVKPVSPPPPPAPAPEPVVVPESIPAPPPPPPPPVVDEEALRRKISDELHKGFEQERAKAEQELQAWLEAEKAQAAAKAHADAQSQVQDEVSRMLSAERALAQGSLQQALVRERLAAEDERHRAHVFAKQLEAREADLKKQDAFYREQVARLEERSAQFFKVTTENFHKAADEVNAKYRRYEVYPVCADLQGQILTCYKENVGKTLHCSNIAALYLQCVNNAKQPK
uniref:Coiled-coil-helix-coiled-coil-helix domain containing 3a n=1 Tax=Cynoglossus semilaevis TaxID=244447 RepID=A0A3P8VCH4_CYNSE